MTGLLDSAQRDDNDEVVEGSDRNLSKSKKSENVKSEVQTRLGAMEELIFLTFNVKKA